MKIKKTIPTLGVILGAVFIIAAFYFRQDLSRSVGGVIFGIGGAILGVNLTELIGRILLERNPAKAAQQRIAKTLEIAKWLVLGLAFLSILADSPLWFTLSITLIYLLIYIIEWIFQSQLLKKM
jgi:hypothetical protein